MEEDINTPWHQRAKEDLERQKIELVGTDGENGEREQIKKKIEDEASQNMRAYSPNQQLYKRVLVGYSLAQGILTIVSILLMLLVDTVANINLGLLILLLQLAHVGASFKSVGVEDLAGTTFFGRPTSEPEPGLIFVPWLLMRLHKVSRNYKDFRFPGPADKILRLSTQEQAGREFGDVPTSDQADEGYVRPIIVVSGEPRLSAKEKKLRTKGSVDPFDERNSFEIAYVVRYRPNQEAGGIFRLIRNIGLPTITSSLETMMVDHLRENSERDIKAMISRHTLATTIQNKALMDEVFAYRVQVSVMRLGIDIDPKGTGLDDYNPSHETNEALANARRARFNHTRTMIDADAERERTIRVGKGIAEAERLLLEARAIGLKKIKEEAKVDGNVAIASETARNFKDANTIFGAQGIKEIMSMSDLFKKNTEEKE